MAELIQCPFCGRIPTVEDCGTNRWFVRCQCGIAQDKLYHQRCDAVREWNRRKPITDVPSAVVGTQMSLADYISRQAAKNKKVYSEERHEYVIPVAEIDWLPSAQPEQSIAEWQKDFREYINMLNIPRDDYKGIMEYINEVPSAQPEIIRCKDCKYRLNHYCHHEDTYNLYVHMDGYCSRGERRNEAR